MGRTFEFTADLWEYGGEASWFFVTVPEDQSDEIADQVPQRTGFGSVRVDVTLGASNWSTSLFPARDLGAYVLPVKRAVREREGLEHGDSVDVVISLAGD